MTRLRVTILALWVLSFVASHVIADDRTNWTEAHWLREGNRLLADGKPAAALDAYDQALSHRSDSAAAHYNRGVALYRLQRFDEAETALQNALRPDAPELEASAKYNLARSAHAQALSKPEDPEQIQKGLQRAIDFYNDALLVNPDSADAKDNLAKALRQQAFVKKIAEQLKQQNQQQQEAPGKQDNNQEDQNEQNQQNSGESQQQSSDQQSDEQQSSDSQQQAGDQQQQKTPDGLSRDDSQMEGSEDSQQPPQQTEGSGEIDMEALQKELERELNQVEEELQKRESGESDDNKNSNEGLNQLSKEQLEQLQQQLEKALDEAEQQRPQAGESDHQDDREDATDAQQDATSQPAEDGKGETAAEQSERISRERALRLLQEARDKEALRRQMQKRARQDRQRGRAVEKDW